MSKIYVFACKSHFKVGVSSDVAERLKSVQTGCPSKLSILLVYDALRDININKLESAIHKKLRDFNSMGEWFRRTEESEGAIRSIFKILEVNDFLVDTTDDFYCFGHPTEWESILAGIEV